MTLEKKILLALDFDGVIADSIKECLVIAHNAFTEFNNQGQKISLFDELNQKNVPELRKLRNFIRFSEDYVYIHLAIQQKAVIQDQKDFDSFTEKNKNFRDTFLKLFLKERDYFSVTKLDLWIKLNPLYAGICDYLTSYTPKSDLFVITTKKISYVKKILSGNNIQLQENNLFQANSHRTKRVIISELLEKHQVSPDQFYFIDDQVDTLIKVVDTGVNCLLAEWGYNDPVQQQNARLAHIKIITLYDLLNNSFL